MKQKKQFNIKSYRTILDINFILSLLIIGFLSILLFTEKSGDKLSWWQNICAAILCICVVPYIVLSIIAFIRSFGLKTNFTKFSQILVIFSFVLTLLSIICVIVLMATLVIIMTMIAVTGGAITNDSWYHNAMNIVYGLGIGAFAAFCTATILSLVSNILLWYGMKKNKTSNN